MEVLKEEKVDTIFGITGGAIIDIFDELAKTDIRHINVRHEQAAVHAADGYARAKKKVGVCLVTSGPGATNTVSGIASAYMDSIPLVIFTGQIPTRLIGNDAFQEVDIVGITRPCTKHNYLVRSIEDLTRVVKEAFYIARSGRPGPVLVDLPKDIIQTKENYKPLPPPSLKSYSPTYRPNKKQLNKALKLIQEAKKPVIFAGGSVIEDVTTSEEFPMDKARDVLKDETVAVLGYGVQGPAQALNMKDNGINVIVGQRKEEKVFWDKALNDGFKEGQTLFSVEEAAERGTIIQMLISDAGQMAVWPRIKRHLQEGNALYFSHGFSIVYGNQTKVIPPDNVDVIMVAPKGSGTTVRSNFLEGKGINSSYAVFQDYTGKATERTLAIGIAIGSGYLFPTTFENEVHSDLVGERGVLMGCLAGVMEAQYNTLRKHGHSPSESFNETVEELTQSLIRLVAENGMDWMYANCSTTAQRGALDWRHKFRDAVAPLFGKLYESVVSGEETRIVLEANSAPDYMEKRRKGAG
jgi:ketol-acid reductoisomerase